MQSSTSQEHAHNATRVTSQPSAPSAPGPSHDANSRPDSPHMLSLQHNRHANSSFPPDPLMIHPRYNP
eukprot:2140278-Prymnesium_polylepis.1